MQKNKAEILQISFTNLPVRDTFKLPIPKPPRVSRKVCVPANLLKFRPAEEGVQPSSLEETFSTSRRLPPELTCADECTRAYKMT